MKYYKLTLASFDNTTGFCYDGSGATYGGSTYVYGCLAGGDLGVVEAQYAACTNGTKNTKGTVGEKYYGCTAGPAISNNCSSAGGLVGNDRWTLTAGACQAGIDAT